METKIKAAVVFLIKALIFTIVFWTVWLFLLRPMFYGASDESNKAAEASDAALRDRYWEQADRMDALQQRYDDQFKQADEALKRQNELLNRWEKIIERWEKSAPSKK